MIDTHFKSEQNQFLHLDTDTETILSAPLYILLDFSIIIKIIIKPSNSQKQEKKRLDRDKDQKRREILNTQSPSFKCKKKVFTESPIIYLMKQSKLPYILPKIVSNLDIQLYLKQTTSPFYILDLTHSSWQVSLFNFLYKVLPK